MPAAIDPQYVEEVDRALREWQQGDVVLGGATFVHLADLKRPLTDASREDSALGETSEGGSDIATVLTDVYGLVVVTQTCDLVRSCKDRPFVEVAPLVLAPTDALTEIKLGRFVQYAFVPGIEEHALVAHLDRIMTVEKAVLAGFSPIRGCRTDAELRLFAEALRRKRGRFAFPDDFTVLVDRFRNRVVEKHKRQSTEGKGLRALREIRVQATPSWAAEEIELFFWFVRLSGDDEIQWQPQVESWLALIPPSGRYKTVSGAAVTLDDMTARDFVDSDQLDLDHLSVAASASAAPAAAPISRAAAIRST